MSTSLQRLWPSYQLYNSHTQSVQMKPSVLVTKMKGLNVHESPGPLSVFVTTQNFVKYMQLSVYIYQHMRIQIVLQ